MILEIAADDEKTPRMFNRSVFSEESASQKAYLVIDDLHDWDAEEEEEAAKVEPELVTKSGEGQADLGTSSDQNTQKTIRM